MNAILMCCAKRTAVHAQVLRQLTLVVLVALASCAQASASPVTDGGEAGSCEQWTHLGITLQEGNGVNGSVRALTLFRGELIAAGAFTEASGIEAKNVAAWTDGAGWRPLGDGVDFSVRAMAVWNDQLIVGGQTQINSETPGICLMRWDGEAWVSLGEFSEQPYNLPMIRSLAVHEDLLVAAGFFMAINGEPFAGVAAWDGKAWLALDQGLPGIRSLTIYQDQLYAGGAFYSLSASVARWNGKTWSAIPGSPSSGVEAIGVWRRELVVAGGFSSAGGRAATGIARWDGKAWHPFQQGVGFTVQVIGAYNGDLIAGGSFMTAGQFRANRIARWNGSVWQPIGLGMEGTPATVYAIQVYEGKLVASGSFSAAGGTPTRSIARWEDCPGSVGACCIDNTCTEMLASSCTVLAGSYLGPGTRCFGMRCPTVCERWQSMRFPMYGAWINAIVPYDGGLVVGGKLPSSAMNNIAWWDGSEWHPIGGGIIGEVTALCVYDGELYAGWYSNNTGRISKWNGTTWMQVKTFGPVGLHALLEWDGLLVAATGSIVRYWAGGDVWPSLGLSMNSLVLTLCVHQNELIAGGIFTAAGVLQCSRVARFDVSTFTWRPLGLGVDQRVHALFSHGSDLYAGGDFKHAGGLPAMRVARWDGSDWHALGQGIGDPLHDGFGESVRAIAMYRGQLIAGGFFSEAGGQPIPYLARWRDDQWKPLGLGTSGQVRALLGWNHDLLVGGSFLAAGPWASSRIARWSDCAGSLGDLNGDGVVNALDLLILLAAWGPCATGECAADLDESGAVDVQDLLILFNHWG